jgi:hypothetical protein
MTQFEFEQQLILAVVARGPKDGISTDDILQGARAMAEDQEKRRPSAKQNYFDSYNNPMAGSL